MAENLTLTYGYTAKDLAAVRAYVQRVAPAIIARTYYDVDEDSFAATPSAMERHLRTMLEGLVKVAIEHGSAALAEHLRSSIKKHGQPKLTAVTFRMELKPRHWRQLPPRRTTRSDDGFARASHRA